MNNSEFLDAFDAYTLNSTKEQEEKLKDYINKQHLATQLQFIKEDSRIILLIDSVTDDHTRTLAKHGKIILSI